MGNAIIGFINYIIASLGNILKTILSVLPDSPFEIISNTPVASYLSELAWIIPFAQIFAILQSWIVSVSLFYLSMVILRWVKAIE